MENTQFKIGLVILGLLCLFYSIQPVHAIQYANLYVHVTDCATGEILPGTSVTANGNVYQTAYTDNSGTALFSSLVIYYNARADYQITVSRTGYDTKTTATTILCSQTHHIYMCLDKNIVCGVAVQGTSVQDSIVSSTIRNTGNSQETITVKFYLDGSSIGSTSVTLAAGASTTVQHSVQAGCGNHNVRVEAVANCGSIAEESASISSNCKCKLNVNVYDENQKSIEANLYLDGSYARYSSFFTTDISAGNHKIEARGGNYDSDYKNIICNSNEAINVDLILSRQQCIVEVHVMDGSGNDINQAMVEVDSVKKLAASNGVVIYEEVTPGNHRASASKDGYGSDASSFTCEKGERKTIELFLTEQIGNLKVHVSDCSNGKALQGASVDVIESINDRGMTNEYGYAYFSNLPDGSYEVSARMDGYDSNYKNNVRVTRNVMTVVEVCIKKTNGNSDEDDGNCVVNVHSRDNDGDALQANLYVDGNYRTYDDYASITVSSGSHTIKAIKSGYATDSQTITCHNGESLTVYLDLDSGDDNNNCEDGDCEECDIRIYIEDKDGDSLKANIYVDNHYKTEDHYKQVTVDEGSHTIKATRSGYRTDSEEVDCNNGETEIVRLTLKKTVCDEDEDCEDEVGIMIKSITIDPTEPTFGEVVRGEVKLELLDDSLEDESFQVRIYIDSSLEKLTTMSFNGDDMVKTITFAFESGDYSIGSHTIQVKVNRELDSVQKTKTFSIRDGGETGSVTPVYPGRHCLKINDIQLENSNIKIGQTAKIDIIVSNCGDVSENSIAVKLEDSTTRVSGSFFLAKGSERKVTMDYVVGSVETLTFTAYNSYYQDSKTFKITPETGYLAIYLDPSYNIYAREDNKITFRVKNIGVIEDTFSLTVSENVRPWVYGLPKTITLKPGEEANIDMFVNSGSQTGTYDFGITAATAASEKTVVSRINVGNRFSWPTGFFGAISGSLWWLLWLLLLIIILIVIFLILRELWRRWKNRGNSKNSRDTSKNGKADYSREENSSRKSSGRDEEMRSRTRVREAIRESQASDNTYIYENNFPASPATTAVEDKTAGKTRRKFWWDRDCVEYNNSR